MYATRSNRTAFGFVTDAESLLMLCVCQTAVHFLTSWLFDIQDWSPSNDRRRGLSSVAVGAGRAVRVNADRNVTRMSRSLPI
jgi:hypothetical protein